MSIDLSLQRISKLLSQLGPYTRPTVHIAGTNGKGSVSAILTHIFLSSGLSVGRFNSPHLVDVYDSISLNNAPVSATLYNSTYEEVRAIDDAHNINTSSFELLTVTALQIFEKTKVDVVVCEVGLGGRLDATNVIPDEAILASVITAIDLDHTAFLGSTVEKIAREKAGIIRGGRPVILSSQSHIGVEDVVRSVCDEKGSRLICAPLAREREWNETIDGIHPPPFSIRPFRPPPPRPIELNIDEENYRILLPLHGDHQLGNLGAALTVIDELKRHFIASEDEDNKSRVKVFESIRNLSKQALHTAVRSCTWAGRLSFHTFPTSLNENAYNQPVILADGAHNEAAAIKLSSYISSLLASLSEPASTGLEYKKLNLTFILGLSHSPPKTPESILLPLLSPFCSKTSGTTYKNLKIKLRIALMGFSTPEGMPWVRNVPPSQLAEVIRNSFSTSSFNARSENPSNTSEEMIGVWVSPDEQSGNAQNELNSVLKWVAEGGDDDSLVIVAGSLYLVADLYRILDAANKRV